LESRFERVTVEVKSHADAKNVALSRKLGGLSEMLEIKVKKFSFVKISHLKFIGYTT